MSDEPLPCPFCGSTDVEPVLITASELTWAVMCPSCLTHGPETTRQDAKRSVDMIAIATERWNRRHVLPARRRSSQAECVAPRSREVLDEFTDFVANLKAKAEAKQETDR